MSRGVSHEEQTFADALTRPAHERVAFVDGACNGGAALRARILALLAAHAGPESLLATAPSQRFTNHEEQPGDAIGLPSVGSAKEGRYKLLQKIGEGGCGVVWMAEQDLTLKIRQSMRDFQGRDGFVARKVVIGQAGNPDTAGVLRP